MSTVAGSGVEDASCAARSRLAFGEVVTEMRGEWPLARLSATGIVGSAGSGQHLTAGRARGAVWTPTWRSWRVEASFARDADDAQCFSALPLSREEVRISRGGRRQGFWLGYGTSRGAWFDTLRSSPGTDTMRSRIPVGASRSLTGGVWRNAGPVLVSLSIGSRSQASVNVSSVLVGNSGPDSIWSDSAGRFVPAPITPVYERRTSRQVTRLLDSEIRVGWAHGKAAVDVRAGGVLGRPGGRGAPRWATGSLSFWISPEVALIGEATRQSASGSERPFGHRRASIGVRLSPAPFSRPSAATIAPARPAVSEFRLRSLGTGTVLLSVRAPHARVVELSGDFLAWKPVRLERVSTDWWEMRFSLPSGPHRVNLRLDGAGWIAPPGVPTLKDEFGGEVGVIVVP